MATNSGGRVPVSWDDVLAAINPPRQTPEEMYEGALDAIVLDWQAGYITEEEGDNLIKELMTARMRYEVGKLVGEAFTPSDNARRAGKAAPRRFSLL